MIRLLTPWEFDPFAVLGLAAALGLYLAGIHRGARPAPWRSGIYLAGVLAMYAVLHTRLDYYAQYLFFAHRGQHLVLHHLGPFLIALANPLPVWRRALGGGWRVPASVAAPYRILQQPFVAGLLFVGLIALWLVPELHFDAMLDRELYLLMNWSMAVDGLLFWWLMLAPRSADRLVDPSYGTRMLVLAGVMFPQIAIGAFLALGPADLYDVYAVCGRAFPIAPEQDQRLGGLLTWIPAAMMSVAGMLVVLRRWRRQDAEPSASARSPRHRVPASEPR